MKLWQRITKGLCILSTEPVRMFFVIVEKKMTHVSEIVWLFVCFSEKGYVWNNNHICKYHLTTFKLLPTILHDHWPLAQIIIKYPCSWIFQICLVTIISVIPLKKLHCFCNFNNIIILKCMDFYYFNREGEF